MQARLIVSHRVQPREPKASTQNETRANPHSGFGILSAGSRRSAFTSHDTSTIGFRCGHLRCSFISIATSYAARSWKRFVGIFFFTGCTEIKGRLKKAFYQYIETIFSNMAARKILDEMFDCSIERWKQRTMFMDASAARARSSSRFSRSVPDFVCTHVDETANIWQLTARSEGYSQPVHV